MKKTASFTPLNQVNRFFSLITDVSENQIHIVMELNIDIVNTRYIPKTVKTLKKNYPSVLRTECFNDEGLEFKDEVKKTEIGHLFEHILLDSLCREKMARGSENACFSGRTDWNWKRDKRGVFHIFIEAGKEILPILQQAMSTAVYHTELVLDTAKVKTNN